MCNTRKKHIIINKAMAVCFIVVLCVVMTAGTLVCIDAFSHDCQGEGCPYCAIITLVTGFFRSAFFAVMAIVLLSFRYYFLKNKISFAENGERKISPVIEKVKISA